MLLNPTTVETRRPQGIRQEAKVRLHRSKCKLDGQHEQDLQAQTLDLLRLRLRLTDPKALCKVVRLEHLPDVHVAR